MTARIPMWLGVVAGLLAVAGVVVFATAGGSREIVYEGSYAPLEPGSSVDAPWTMSLGSDPAVLWTAQHAIGAALLAAALLVLALLVGWLLGRRSAGRWNTGP